MKMTCQKVCRTLTTGPLRPRDRLSNWQPDSDGLAANVSLSRSPPCFIQKFTLSLAKLCVFAAVAVLACSVPVTVTVTVSAQQLQLTAIRAGANGFYRAPVIVSNEANAVLIDGGFTFSDGQVVANALLNSGKNVSSIFITQSDPDYYFSLLPIKTQFPQAAVLSPPSTLQAIEDTVQAKLVQWASVLQQNGPQSINQIVFPNATAENYFKVNGSEDIIEVFPTPLPNRYYLWCPTLKAILGGVLVFADVHVWVGDLPSVEQRATWVNILDEMIALNPAIVIPGHMDLNSTTDVSALIYTRDYLLAYQREASKAANSSALIQAMNALYPNAGFETALVIGAQAVMQLLANSTTTPAPASTSTTSHAPGPAQPSAAAAGGRHTVLSRVVPLLSLLALAACAGLLPLHVA